ncbi:recombination protein RecR [candidate division WWE3 bacterium RIFCSPHIGHO2_01_FULL_48_15]|uniref:Recombination protein RecR n=1 Tax=candidate division WWE3 bacterium RIFCSPHIGHO2_01_FULL_48_15 TaxID=1802619 RepID=A0A1F4VAI7_UNCKA|nr:MAG: recombination protein RecR [candidate division WWE3 bacterium RIFCSPHIGHO2_01_FULL_48_15]
MKIPKAIQNMIEAFERLPGIGPKTAARLTFYLLNVPETERTLLGQAVLELGKKTRICERCFNICEAVLCEVCTDDTRDQGTVCVVEDPLDLIAFEKTGKYLGLYHVLGGAISPLEHIGPEDLKIAELITRLKPLAISQQPVVKEIILATNPSLEGEATAMYIKKLIEPLGVKITRIARGIPTGGDLEYADELTLTKSLEGRQEF